jgi:hypothetical protein
MDVLTFASGLPQISRAPNVLDGSRGVTVVEEISEGFVNRGLDDLAPADGPADGPVQLIVAPAAVGKSTCARAIAAKATCLLVNLTGRQVGDGTFIGILLEALAESDAIQTLGGLRDSTASIILDALDETHLRSGDLNFLAFIQGICRFTRTSAGVGNIVLLSRLETASWVANTFAEEGVPLRQLQISYFNETQSYDFIDQKLDELYLDRAKQAGIRPSSAVRRHRSNRATYETARQALVDRIASALAIQGPAYWDADVGRRFLGYAPVLDTVSSYLCVANHDVLSRQIAADEPISPGHNVREWAILRSLCESLLIREQEEKFIPNFWTEDLAATAPTTDPAYLYTPTEQCARLLARVEQGSERDDLPAHLPAELRAIYREKVKELLISHPFLSTDRRFVNDVFRDYVYAVALLDGPASEAGRTVLSKIRSGEELPSPLVGPLMIELLTGSNVATLDSDLCDLLLESLQSQEDRGLTYEYAVAPDGAGYILEIRRHTADSHGYSSPVMVPMRSAAGGLLLPSRCRNLTIDYAGDVRIGGANRAIHLGPSVSIRCATLEILGSEFVVDAPSDDASVIIESDLVVSTYPLPIRVFGSAFALLSRDVDGPLRGFAREPKVQVNEGHLETFYALRRLLSYFRKTVHTRQGELAAQAEFMDRNVFNVNPAARRLIHALIRDRYAYLESSHYILRIGELAKQGVNFMDVQSFNVSPALERFLERYSSELSD